MGESLKQTKGKWLKSLKLEVPSRSGTDYKGQRRFRLLRDECQKHWHIHCLLLVGPEKRKGCMVMKIVLQMFEIYKLDSAVFMGSHHYLIYETSLV